MDDVVFAGDALAAKQVDETDIKEESADQAAVVDTEGQGEMEESIQDNDEPIHDLFDLGAVEYHEESEKVL
jgi:hypothetical protein